MRWQSVVFVLLTGAACVGTTGCGKDADEVKYHERRGTVSAIDPATGIVEMTWHNPKKNVDQQLVGKLASDAEILIDGVTARLDDVRVGDDVMVTGRVEKHDQLVATRVEILRKEAPASEPASRPATASADAH
jgi:hypothetical protein